MNDEVPLQRAAATPSAFAQPWLTMQCGLISGVSQAILALDADGAETMTAAASWPAGVDCPPDLAATLATASERRRAVIRTGVRAANNASGTWDLIALPLIVDGHLAAVVAIRLTARGNDELRSAMRMLKWGTGWLELIAQKQASAVNDSMARILDLVATALAHHRFEAAARAVVTELAATLGCEMACLGIIKRGSMRLEAVSNSASFSGNMNLTRRIEYAMDEAAVQQSSVVFPLTDPRVTQITHAHAQLAKDIEAAAFCTVPLVGEDGVAGALFLQHTGDARFDRQTVEFCECLAAMLWPVLELKRRDDRNLLAKNVAAIHGQLRHLFGPDHLATKLVAGSMALLLAALALIQGDYRVAAAATVEGSVQRAVIAPSDGYIAEASARPGDIVSAGDPLGKLDRKTLDLERTKWQSKKEQLSRQYRNALADYDRVQANILNAQMDQAEAELELVGEQLSHVDLLAPFDGVVIAGDLSRSLGSPVQRGDVLFQVAPLDEYRVILHVDEHDIGRLDSGQTGYLVLKALPGKPLALSIDRITPVATARDGGNFFVVEARIDDDLDALRPGMEGVAKVNIGRRSLLWIWTHSLIERAGLWLWSWWR